MLSKLVRRLHKDHKITQHYYSHLLCENHQQPIQYAKHIDYLPGYSINTIKTVQMRPEGAWIVYS